MTAPSENQDGALVDAFRGKRVLITGHTGFKGGWLSLWLNMLGAKVVGIAQPPEEGSSLFEVAQIASLVDHRIGDIRSEDDFNRAVGNFDADLIIHMAAQSLVRRSYGAPVDTYLTNVVGTSVVLEAARKMPSLKGIVVVTSDKCYENREWVWGYREDDPMGGADPYSASKGCTELVVASYRHSFFSDPNGPLIASVRAGNVFGGGDWASDRLIPDIVRGAFARTPVVIRNPASIRPWQFVLEPLHGYLTLAAGLLKGDASLAEGWNFGPDASGVVPVSKLADGIQNAWGEGGPDFAFGEASSGPHEAGVLRLDSSKAASRLKWTPKLTLSDALFRTVDWYKTHAAGERDMREFSERQILDFQGPSGVREAA